MSIRSLFPSTRPSLNLDFANTKALDPRVTFARASTATYYDGKTTHKAEENRFTYSEDFTQWSTGRSSVTSNSEIAPDGNQTADTLTSTSTSYPLVYKTKPFSTEGTISCFIKKGTSDFAYLYIDNPGLEAAYFDITNGVVGSYGASFSSSSITSYGNGWYRCSATFSGISGGNLGIGLCDANSNPSSTIGKTIYIWGAQVEQRSSLTAYTPTTSSPITRYAPTLLTAPIDSPRFDHNPATGESLGLLIEEQRTNLVTYSEHFGLGSTWNTIRATVTTNQTIAPDGTITADLLEPIVTTSGGYTRFYINVTSGTTYTFSFFAKYQSSDFPYVFVYAGYEAVSGSGRNVNYFNIQNGTLGTGSGSTYVSHSIEDYGNGWYRCIITTTSDVTGSVPFLIYPAEGDLDISYTSDGVGGIYLWGAQLEVGSFPSSYIPTSGAQATRLADNATITGTNFSSWFNPTEGTFIAECDRGNDGIEGAGICAVRGPAAPSAFSNMIQFGEFYDNSGYVGRVYTNSIAQALFGATHTTGQGIYNKYAFAYKTDDVGAAVNGSDRGTDTSVTLPGTLDRLYFGRYDDDPSSINLDGHIKYLKYFPTRIPNSQLQSLTTP